MYIGSPHRHEFGNILFNLRASKEIKKGDPGSGTRTLKRMLNDGKQKSVDVGKISTEKLEKSDMKTKLSETLRATSRHYTFYSNRNTYKFAKNSLHKMRRSMEDSTKLELSGVDNSRGFNAQFYRRGDEIPFLEAVGRKLN